MMSNNKTGLFAQIFITVLASVSASAAFFLMADKKMPDLFHGKLTFEDKQESSSCECNEQDAEDANLAEAKDDTAEV